MSDFKQVKDAVSWEDALAVYNLSEWNDKRPRECPKCGKAKLKRSNVGFGCEGCTTGTNPVDFIAAILLRPAEEIRDELADRFQIAGHRGGRFPRPTPANPVKKQVSTPVARELAPDGYSMHSATFEQRPFNDGLASLLAIKKKPVTLDAMNRVGCQFASWKQFTKSNAENVIGLPVYAGPNLDLVNWSMYNSTGGLISARKKVENKKYETENVATRMAFPGGDRTGIFVSLADRGLLLAGKPIENLRIIKCEGGTDLLAWADRIPAGEPWIVLSSSFGCRWSDSLDWLLPMLTAIKPVECVVIPDCDQAGLDGGMNWARELSAIATTKVIRLPFEIGTKSDVRDYLNAGNGFPELRALIDSTAVFNPNDYPKKKKAKQVSVPGVATGDEDNESIEHITNFETIFTDNDDGSTTRTDEPIPILEIAQAIFDHSDNWPKRVGSELFVLQDGESRPLKKPSSLLAWLRESIEVNWKQGPKLASKEEIFEIVSNHAEQFDLIEKYPHFPPIPGIYYTCKDRPAGDGKHLEAFLDFFCPATPIDRQLLLAAISTTFWGGPPGGRPGFQFAALSGQGAGKSTAAATLAMLSGGSIDFDQDCKREEITKRLLNGDDGSRVIFLDNIKAKTFGNASFESLITSKTISGHKMFCGNASKPNHFSVFVTFNSAEFSRDMAQRLVSIVLGDAVKTADWQINVDTFIAEHHDQIIDDIKAFYDRPKVKLSRYNRWATWQGEIVSRLDDPESIIRLLQERENGNDGDAKAATDILGHLTNYLLEYLFVDPCKVHVGFSELAKIVSHAIGSPHTAREAGLLIDRLVGSGLITNMKRNPCRTDGKGFLFWSAEGYETNVSYDLAKRIEQREILDDNAKQRRQAIARKAVYDDSRS
ncbi:MAG TPA: hypothetical protein VM260_27880 [Pirellula sp.]|nr:hypothetical protein [Pirellula sp.]